LTNLFVARRNNSAGRMKWLRGPQFGDPGLKDCWLKVICCTAYVNQTNLKAS